MYLVDTNVLEVMLSGPRKGPCRRLLDLLKRGEETGIVTDFSVHSIMVILGGLAKKRELRIFLTSLSAYRGLSVHATTLSEEVKAVDTSLERGLDIDDSVQYSAALTAGVKGIVSFDRHFDGLDVPRLDPQSLVE